MNKILVVFAVLMFLMISQFAKSACLAEGLGKDIEEIKARKDFTISERKREIEHAKESFKQETIECALTGEKISEKAAMLAESYIINDLTTKPEAAQTLIEKIRASVPQ